MTGNDNDLQDFLKNLVPMPDEARTGQSDFIDALGNPKFRSAKEITWNNRVYVIGDTGNGYSGYVWRGGLPQFLAAHKERPDRPHDISKNLFAVSRAKTEEGVAVFILEFDRIIQEFDDFNEIVYYGEILDPDMSEDRKIKLYELFGGTLKRLMEQRRRSF